MTTVESRYYLDASPEAEKEVRFLLRQTTELWNCIIAHVGEVVLDIAKTDHSDHAVSKIRAIAEAAFNLLIMGNDNSVDFAVSGVWKKKIRNIRRLPKQVMLNRLEDLIDAYMYVNNKYKQGIEWEYVPTIKGEGSTETLRLSPDLWTNDGDSLMILLNKATVILNVPMFSNVSKLTAKPSVTITKKRPARIRNSMPTNGIEKKSLYLTLSFR